MDSPSDRTIGRTLSVWLLAAGILCRWATDCPAQFTTPQLLSKTRVTLPQADPKGGRPASSGFDATVEVSNLFGVGYVGVSARLDSTLGPLATTRELAIRLIPIDRHMPASRSIAVEMPLSFEQGQTQVSLARAFPKWTIGNSFRIEIVEDGVPLTNYSSEIGSSFPKYAVQTPATVLPNELLINLLLVDTELQTLEGPSNIVFFPPNQLYAKQSATLESLPADWRLLRDVDCIVIPRDALAGVTGKTGDTAGSISALRDWVMMGGTLIVLSAGEVDEVARLLRFSLTQSSRDDEAYQIEVKAVVVAAEERGTHYREWLSRAGDQPQDPDELLSLPFVGQVETVNVPTGVGYDQFVRPNEQQLSATRKWLVSFEAQADAFEASWSNGFRRFVGGGQIIGLPDAKIDENQSLQLLEKLVGFQKSTILERGVDPLMGDARSRRWLIPGVAEPPVYTFMGILTLFVLLVGPIAYRWTTRGHRSHLMFLIAPALAVITTAVMFSYSIISDGFGTTVRVRQLTWVDGASGDAAERTRSTLFSGISPQAGLRFAADAEVMAYPRGGGQTWKDLKSEVDEVRLRTEIDDSVQHFESPFLPSRTQSQFVSHRIRHGLGAIALEGLRPFDSGGTNPGSDSVTLSSTLPFEVLDLVARSEDGRYWKAKKIGAGETISPSWIPKSQDASKLLGELYLRNRLVGAVSRSGRNRRGQEIGDLVLFVNRQIDRNALVTDGTFEHWLNGNLFIRGELPVGMFVAISEPSADVIAVDDAVQVESVRYVMGTLK